MTSLFSDHPDLLIEFTQFLPEAAKQEAKIRLTREVEKSVERKKALKRRNDKKDGRYDTDKKDKILKDKALRDIEKFRNSKGDRDIESRERERDRQKRTYSDKKSKKEVYNEWERRGRFAMVEGALLPAEWHFFERARKVLPTRDSWREFLKCLDMYSQDVLTLDDMLTLVSDLFGRHTDLVRDFKKILDEHGARETHNDVWFSMPLAEIDFSKCRRCTPSYRALPTSYPFPVCSVRTELERKVCNDAWVSVPTGSEDFSFKNMRKNQYEEALFKCEDERFEIDMIIDANSCTIQILEPLAKEIELLKSQENVADAQWQYRIDRRTLGTIHINAISRVYGESGNDILELLRKYPAGAIPIILERLKQKDTEWRFARQDLNKQWKEVNDKNFHKSLDHCSFYFKQQDKKLISTKSLVSEASKLLQESTPIEEIMGESKSDKKNTTWKPHFKFEFSSAYMHRVAYAVLAYAVENSLSQMDKERVYKVWSDFLLPLMQLPEEWMTKSIQKDNERNVNPSNIAVSDDATLSKSTDDDTPLGPHECLVYDCQITYAFTRLYHLLYERLLEANRLCEKMKNNRNKKTFNPAARALDHQHHVEPTESEDTTGFESYIATLYSLLDGSIDSARYEDSCRNLMGSSSYLLFTADKLVSQILKQLQKMAVDETSIRLNALWCKVQTEVATLTPNSYLEKAKEALDGEYAYRIQFHRGVLRKTQLDVPSPRMPTEGGKIWAPSPKVKKFTPCPWLVKPSVCIKYLGDISIESEEDTCTEDGTITTRKSLEKKRKLSVDSCSNTDLVPESQEATGVKRSRIQNGETPIDEFAEEDESTSMVVDDTNS